MKRADRRVPIDSTGDLGKALRRISAASILLAPLLSGCATRGFSIDGAVPDKASITGSVDQAQLDARLHSSDANTIRNAVSAIDLDRLDPQGAAWSNPVSGNSGMIFDVADKRDRGGLCRLFHSSIVSYNGVQVFSGRACMDRFGFWSLTSFEPA